MAQIKVVVVEQLRLKSDKLALAIGSYPFMMPIHCNDNEHCLVYRTIEEIEAASALNQDGLKTYVVEFAPQLMGKQVDTRSGELLKAKIDQNIAVGKIECL